MRHQQLHPLVGINERIGFIRSYTKPPVNFSLPSAGPESRACSDRVVGKLGEKLLPGLLEEQGTRWRNTRQLTRYIL